jgi:hypothetical protein
MAAPVDRRTFVARSLALAAMPGMSLGRSLAAAPADSPDGLSTYDLGPQFWIRWNNRMVTGYRAHRSQKLPYLFPLTGPASGLPLTSESALPYPHHRSAWFGCDRVNGGNYWQEGLDRGQILSNGPRWGTRTETSAEILDTCEWRRPGGPVVMTDQRRITVRIQGPQYHSIDWDLTWTAVEAVTIPQTNHSLFAVRAAPELTPTGGGTLVNAEGATGEKGTYGHNSKWCAFHGTRPGGVTEGIALLDHPQNPWSPCPWFTRDYGFMSPTPLYFGQSPWTLAAGAAVRLRYRLVLFSGSPEPLATWYKEWAA